MSLKVDNMFANHPLNLGVNQQPAKQTVAPKINPFEQIPPVKPTKEAQQGSASEGFVPPKPAAVGCSCVPTGPMGNNALYTSYKGKPGRVGANFNVIDTVIDGAYKFC